MLAQWSRWRECPPSSSTKRSSGTRARTASRSPPRSADPPSMRNDEPTTGAAMTSSGTCSAEIRPGRSQVRPARSASAIAARVGGLEGRNVVLDVFVVPVGVVVAHTLPVGIPVGLRRLAFRLDPCRQQSGVEVGHPRRVLEHDPSRELGVAGGRFERHDRTEAVADQHGHLLGERPDRSLREGGHDRPGRRAAAARRRAQAGPRRSRPSRLPREPAPVATTCSKKTSRRAGGRSTQAEDHLAPRTWLLELAARVSAGRLLTRRHRTRRTSGATAIRLWLRTRGGSPFWTSVGTWT